MNDNNRRGISMADRKYDSIVYDFFEKQGGAAVLLSEDPVFKKMLSSTIFKILGTKRDCLWTFENIKPGLKQIQACQKNKIDCVVFIERAVTKEGEPPVTVDVRLDRHATRCIFTDANGFTVGRIVVIPAATADCRRLGIHDPAG